MKTRPYTLTIAGLDPTAGAGIIADCKTFEALNCYGLSVCTANTIQTDTEFYECHWTNYQIIERQLTVILRRFSVDFIKLGIVENWAILKQITSLIKTIRPAAKLVLDPVLSSSTQFEFQTEFNESIFDDILTDIHILTPNAEEIEKLYPNKSREETIEHIRSKTNLLVKGGHNKTNKGKDMLLTPLGKTYPLNPKLNPIPPKHGSGCILSSAITAYLALGFPLLKSVFRAKRFTEKYLNSTSCLLGNFNF